MYVLLLHNSTHIQSYTEVALWRVIVTLRIIFHLTNYLSHYIDLILSTFLLQRKSYSFCTFPYFAELFFNRSLEDK